MSTLDELVRLLVEDENQEVLEKAVGEVLEFSLSANERQSTVVSMGSDRHSKKVRLLRKDVELRVVIVRLLGKEVHPALRLQTTKCLANLADFPQNRVKIASYSCVLDALTSQLKTDNSALVQEHTARCLASLAEMAVNHMTMASSSVLDPLVTLLASDASQQVHQQAARCLANLAMSEKNKERIGNYPGLLDALATSLDKQGGSDVHRYTTTCLANLASSQEIQLKIVSDYSTVLNGLVRLLGENGTSGGQQQSLKCLTSLADHYQRNQVDIASHSGVLDALLRLLRHNWATTARIRVQAEAARCLLKLLSAPENLSTIASHVGAFDALVRCLEPSRRIREVQNLAMECFRRLAEAPDNQLKIVSFPGTVSALQTQLVQSENSNGQELAAWCLSKLATSMETKVVLTHYPGLLKSLLGVLNRSNSAQLEPAMKCLMKLAQSDELKVRVKITSYHGMIDALVSLLGSRMNPTVVEHAANCLSCLALSPQNAEVIISHPKVLNSLLHLLQQDTYSDVLEYTAKCLTNLACSEESQVRMASLPGMLDVLLLSLTVRNEGTRRVQEQVIKCLAQLSAPPANQENIASIPGLHDALRQLALDDVHPRAQKQAELCLENLELTPVAETDVRTFPPGLAGEQQHWREFRNRDSLSDPDDWYVDPITWDIMCDPVKCNDGVTYDRWTLINNGILKSPYDRSLTQFRILIDDIDVRRRLFRMSPQQEAKFRGLRTRYRDKALLSARSLEFEDAIERLNNVLTWAPSDTECKNELEKILNLLDDRSTPPIETQPQNSLSAPPESPENSHELPSQIDRGSGTPAPMLEDQTWTRIPVSHEDVIRVREREEGRMALASVIFVFSLYFAVFLFI